MDPISNVDRLVIMLRQRLLERSRTAANRKPGGRTELEATPSPAKSGIEALETIKEYKGHTAHRAVIQGLLTEHFGIEVINDAQFQAIVSRVTGAIENDSEAAILLDAVIADLRRG